MSMNKLDNFISKQKENSSSQIDPEQELNIWKKAVSSLYKEVRGFLSVYIDSGDVEIKPGTTTLFEEYLGEYEIETATVEIVRKQVYLKPIGTIIFGARGRVDMIGPQGVKTLVFTENADTKPKATKKVTIDGEDNARQNTVSSNNSTLEDYVWVIVVRTPKPTYIELNRESFIDAMLSVVDES